VQEPTNHIDGAGAENEGEDSAGAPTHTASSQYEMKEDVSDIDGQYEAPTHSQYEAPTEETKEDNRT